MNWTQQGNSWWTWDQIRHPATIHSMVAIIPCSLAFQRPRTSWPPILPHSRAWSRKGDARAARGMRRWVGCTLGGFFGLGSCGLCMVQWPAVWSLARPLTSLSLCLLLCQRRWKSSELAEFHGVGLGVTVMGHGGPIIRASPVSRADS